MRAGHQQTKHRREVQPRVDVRDVVRVDGCPERAAAEPRTFPRVPEVVRCGAAYFSAFPGDGDERRSPFVGGRSRPLRFASFRAGCLDCVDILRLPPSGDALRRPARLPLGVVLGAHGAREVGHHAQIQPRPELGERPRAEKVRRHGVVRRRVAIRREPEPSQRPAPDAAVTGDVGGVAALAVLAERLCRLFVTFVAKERRRDAVHAGHSQRPTPERPRVHQVVQLVEQRGDEPRRAPDARAIDLAAVGRRMETSQRRVHVRLLPRARGGFPVRRLFERECGERGRGGA